MNFELAFEYRKIRLPLQAFEKPKYNCGPGQRLPVLMKHYEDDLKVEQKIDMVIRPLRWGLVPSYTKAESIREACRTGNLMINARFLFYFWLWLYF